MKKSPKLLIAALAALALGLAQAKLPAASDEAKAAAAQAAAKAGWAGKVAAFQLCKSQDRTAAHYFKTAQASAKPVKPPVATAPCADPGPFVAAAAAPAAPAPAAADPAKKS